jgi:alpha-N-arabinofuranosidase
MQPTTLTLHTAYQIAEVDPRIFGGFLEHMGRAVYQGVYDPKSAHADAEGFRKDVLAALEPLSMTVMRYPGGNFVSGYHWEDGIGPREKRPTVRELAWRTIEPNQVGTDEFISLSRRMDWTPMLAVNLGTGSPEEARNWVEYCNGEAGTRYADLREANGGLEPHGVKLWCLGNEMDGPWQLGHVPAEQYALRAEQAAKLMKAVDGSIELVACGSCGTLLPTYLEWDRVVLEYLGDLADYVSLHRYVENRADDTADFLAVTNSIDQQIEEMDAACRFVQGKRKSPKRPYLCFDEWNVWYKTFNREGMDPGGDFPRHLIEEIYNLEDALVVAGFLNSFIRHADCVKIANIAQIVNVIAPILTRGDDLLIQSIYHAFEMFSKRREGVALRTAVRGPGYQGSRHGRVHYLDCSAILGEERLKVFATNRSQDEEMDLSIEVADRSIAAPESAELLTGPDAKAANTFDAPDVIRSEVFEAVEVRGGRAHVSLPPLSLLAATLELVRNAG